MTPPVRGWKRVTVVVVFVAAATGTGALVGFGAGVVAMVAGAAPPSPVLLAGLVGTAVVADLVYHRWGQPRPFAVRRQVPEAWSSLFAPPTVALLYGARLGVGPLTILPTWLWWVVLVAGALGGPWVSAVAGGAFGAARTVISVGASQWLQHDTPPRMARLHGWEGAVRVGAALTAVAVAGLLYVV